MNLVALTAGTDRPDPTILTTVACGSRPYTPRPRRNRAPGATAPNRGTGTDATRHTFATLATLATLASFCPSEIALFCGIFDTIIVVARTAASVTLATLVRRVLSVSAALSNTIGLCPLCFL